MPITVTAKKPKVLLTAIKTGIIHERIPSWNIVIGDKIVYFTYTEDDWNFKAFLSYNIVQSGITFHLTGHSDQSPDLHTRGVYYGRFAEMLCYHFDGSFIEIKTCLS